MLNQNKYTTVMPNIRAKQTISFDHTFKVAANIGYLRGDGKWITQYESVFIVMNEHGLVMAWQFMRSTSTDEVKKTPHWCPRESRRFKGAGVINNG